MALPPLPTPSASPDQLRSGAAAEPRPALVGIALGAGCAVVGLLAWLVGGARLPLQNLWSTDTLPGDMPRTLLPVSQYATTAILALLISGGLLAGLLQRTWWRRLGIGAGGVGTGLVAVQVVAVGQSFWVLGDGLGLRTGAADPRAWVYFAGMLGGSLAAVLLAAGVYTLASRRGAVPVALGVGLAAVPTAAWLTVLATSLGNPWGVPTAVSLAVRWLPAVAVGVAIGWCASRTVRGLGPAFEARTVACAGAGTAPGDDPSRRVRSSPAAAIAVGVVDLALLALAPAVLTAISFGLGSRVLNGDLIAMASAARDVFAPVLRDQLGPVVAAAGVAAVTVAALRWWPSRTLVVP